MTHEGENKPFKAYEVLKDAESPSNRYKFALTCIKLEKWQEAEIALTGAKLPQARRGLQNHLNLDENKLIPHGASGFYQLGFVCERQGNNKIAVECYHKALQL